VFEPSRTTTALLEGLHDPADAVAWEQFDRRYRPIVVGFASRLGLADADAADVAQEVMLQFVKEYRAGKYDRQRGRLGRTRPVRGGATRGPRGVVPAG
jgi:hypothetical protein